MQLEATLRESMRICPLFRDLTKEEFSEIVEQTSVCNLNMDDMLFRQQDPAKDFFVLVTGKIKLSLLSFEGTEKVVDIINPGASFAEAVIFSGIPGYPVNATALARSQVLRVNANAYMETLESSPKTCFKVMATLSLRLHNLIGEIDRLSLHNATYRLISFLLEGIPGEMKERSVINLSIPKHVVASRISVTPETLSRTLKRLCQEGLLEVHDSHIVLVNPIELRRLVSI
ncbi:MAG: Crp/Fnr family transcriptional regulator [Sulfurovum sp.]|nr:MAG: Crp/Fnr family transcriptional regulator [Sulfurovum sp.]